MENKSKRPSSQLRRQGAVDCHDGESGESDGVLIDRVDITTENASIQDQEKLSTAQDSGREDDGIEIDVSSNDWRDLREDKRIEDIRNQRNELKVDVDTEILPAQVSFHEDMLPPKKSAALLGVVEQEMKMSPQIQRAWKKQGRHQSAQIIKVSEESFDKGHHDEEFSALREEFKAGRFCAFAHPKELFRQVEEIRNKQENSTSKHRDMENHMLDEMQQDALPQERLQADGDEYNVFTPEIQVLLDGVDQLRNQMSTFTPTHKEPI